MAHAIRITGPAAALAAVPGEYAGEPLSLTDAAGTAIYALHPTLADAFANGPISFANGKLKASRCQVEPGDLRAEGAAAGVWNGMLMAGQRPSLPDMPHPWVKAIAHAAAN